MNENGTPQNTENAGFTTPIAPANTQAPPNTTGSAPTTPPPTYQIPPQQAYNQPQDQYKVPTQGIGSARKEKWPAVVLAFALGTLGIHKFYLGYKSEGLAMLLVSLLGAFCIGLGPAVMAVISIIEAVKYVTLTEEDFQFTYVQGYKGWF